MGIYIYNSAGGNPTAINQGKFRRDEYAGINDRLMNGDKRIEQVGFFEKDGKLPLMQMAGGEFCGNANLSFACLLKELNPDKDEFKFKASGFNGIVTAQVKRIEEKRYFCKAIFPGLSAKIARKELSGNSAVVVDLGGIIHIVISEDDIPFDEVKYVSSMKKIKDELGVDGDAVGVLWIREEEKRIYMKPVIWVKAIDTCFYETSCGSGSIAVGFVKNGNVTVVQRTGKEIIVNIDSKGLSIAAEMVRIN